jgi:hypothetical protein
MYAGAGTEASLHVRLPMGVELNISHARPRLPTLQAQARTAANDTAGSST